MKRIKETITKYQHNGFTLVEVITALAVMTILLAAIIIMLAYFIKEFKSSAAENRKDFYVNEALRLIEQETCSGNEEVKFLENSIELRRTFDKRVDYIKLREGKLILEYTKGGKSISINVILKNLSDFSIDISGRLVVVNIVNSEGEKYSKCIDTTYVK